MQLSPFSRSRRAGLLLSALLPLRCILRPCLILPVGPLCHFRSEFWKGEALHDYTGAMPAKQKRLAELMSKMQMGQRLTADEESEMCREMKESNDMWLTTNMRLRYADDFQAREEFKLMEAVLLKQGFSMDTIEAMVRWQPEHMAAMVQRRVPPPMPAGLNPASIQQMSQSLPSIMNCMTSDAPLSAPPFTANSKALESDVVREELEALMRDHDGLISFGKSYQSFDPLGKEAFLDQLAMIEDRWKVFMTRFQLMGELNPDYVTEREAYLQRIGLTPEDFSARLAEAHELMRAEAQKEGLQR
eukprot:TRINITY_DN99914_c0_g1_i1.p1 TRINITY_DN99914_c0_g1~~TRINITY_DN99914_c0_g1_i1.p1  ORF type:complete len:302 (-),score=74.69 TRINITY_DN99914_c0_g1_i1:68-973(-)